MWDIIQGCSYLWIQLKNSCIFSRLENFPTNSQNICLTHYLLLTDLQNRIALLGYQEKRFTNDCIQLQEIHHPWRIFSNVLQKLEKEWTIKGKISILFIPTTSITNRWNNMPPIHYYLAPSPYGYIAWVEHCVKLRKPDEFFHAANWFYQTRYLTFHHLYNKTRAFFPYTSIGKIRNTFDWNIMLHEDFQILNKQVVFQLYKDFWGLQGELEITFLGVDCLNANKINLLQFLFMDSESLIEDSNS